MRLGQGAESYCLAEEWCATTRCCFQHTVLPSDCRAHREPHLVGRAAATSAGTAHCLPVCAVPWRYFSAPPALQRGNEQPWHRCRRRRHQEFSRTAPMSLGKLCHAVMILIGTFRMIKLLCSCNMKTSFNIRVGTPKEQIQGKFATVKNRAPS